MFPRIYLSSYIEIIQQICLFVNSVAKILQDNDMNDNKKEKQLISVCLRDLRRGRSPAAHYLDLGLLALLWGAVMYLPVRLRFANLAAALTLTAIITLFGLLFALIIERIRLERHIPRIRRRVSDSLLQMSLLEERENVKAFLEKTGAYVPESVECVTADDVIMAKREGRSLIAGFGKPTETAKKLMERVEIKFVQCADLLPEYMIKACRPGENEIDEALLKDRRSIIMRRKRIKLIKPLSRYSAFRYICVGVLLMLLSFVVRTGFYYRLIASVSLFIGSAILTFERMKPNDAAKEKPPAW